MELTGRTYIFAAATLILLAGSLSLFQQHAEAQGGSIALFGSEHKSCLNMSVRTDNISFGCRSDLIGGGSGQVRLVNGAKMVRVGS